MGSRRQRRAATRWSRIAAPVVVVAVLAAACVRADGGAPEEVSPYVPRQVRLDVLTRGVEGSFDLWEVTFFLDDALGDARRATCVLVLRNAAGEVVGGTVLDDIDVAGQQLLSHRFGFPPDVEPTIVSIECRRAGV